MKTSNPISGFYTWVLHVFSGCVQRSRTVRICCSYLGFQRVPALVAMSDLVEVYIAPMPVNTGGIAVPGFVYFESTETQAVPDYRVYSQVSPSRFPVCGAISHGRVGGLFTPLPYRPSWWNYEVCRFSGNDKGTVDCYLWSPVFAPSLYARFEVVDISDPRDWWWGSRYHFVDVASRPPMHTSQGLNRFYEVMS